MAREIKFRAWQEDFKSWAYFSLGHLVSGDTADVAEQCINWGQYTGLRDVKHSEVYESDILKGQSGIIYIVVWDDGGFILKDTLGSVTSLMNWYVDLNDLEVIGNIYENPELLK